MTDLATPIRRDPGMQVVGDSLPGDQRHEAMLRLLTREESNARCPRCRGHLYPKGVDILTGLCWWCVFPRP